jgi:hypothetical protein
VPRAAPPDLGELEIEVDDDDERAVAERFDELGWTDGLPIVAPTSALVNAFLDAAGWDAGDILLVEPVRGREVPASKVAANCVMAGCRPEHLRVVRGVLAAMSDPEFSLHVASSSTGGAAPVVVVNGPVRDELGINCAGNLLAPGFRANATIGRAVRLVLMNCLDARPGVLDRATLGWPGKYSACFGEHESVSPWVPMHVERGYRSDESTVTVFAAESPHNVNTHGGVDGATVLAALAAAVSAPSSFSDGQSLLVVCPEHAARLARDGCSKADLRTHLWEHARCRPSDLFRVGRLEHESAADDTPLRLGRSPDDLLIVVAGGEAGCNSAYFPSWSRGRGSLAVTVAL